MKKITLLILVSILSMNAAFADEKLDKDPAKLCENVWGKYFELESLPVQKKCQIWENTLTLDSFQDKYNTFVLGMMIHYKSEFKYSDSTKWKNHLEFLAQDIEDMKTFQNANITQEQKNKISESIKVQENFYNFTSLQNDLWEKVTSQIEKILTQYEVKIPENKQTAFYELLQKKLDEKIKEMEYTQMVSRFTPEWYKAFLFKMNVYKYMLLLVNGRLG